MDSDGRSLYHYALLSLPRGGQAIMQYLMDHYVFPDARELRAMPPHLLTMVNSQGDTFLHLAAMVSDKESIAYLLSEECPVVFSLALRNRRGQNPKDVAAQKVRVCARFRLGDAHELAVGRARSNPLGRAQAAHAHRL